MNMIKRFLFVALLMMATVSLSAQKVNKDDYITGYGRASGDDISKEKLQDLALADACYRLYSLGYYTIFEGLIDVYAERNECSESVKNQMKEHWSKVWIRAIKEIEIVSENLFESRKEQSVERSEQIVAGVSKSKFCELLDNIGDSVTELDVDKLKNESGALDKFIAGNQWFVEYYKESFKLN